MHRGQTTAVGLTAKHDAVGAINAANVPHCVR